MATQWLKLFPGAERSGAAFLLDGEATFEAIATAIETADSSDHFIYFLGWMVDTDFPLVDPRGPQPTYNTPRAGQTLFDLLRDPRREHVEIRALIWDNPLYHDEIELAQHRLNRLPNSVVLTDHHTYFPADSLRLLEYLANIVKALYRGLGLRASTDKERYYESVLLEPWGTYRNLGAHHDKVVIIKGRKGLIAFCGGLDINRNRVTKKINGREYRFPSYHDTACKLWGPAAYDVLQKFRRRWRNHPVARSLKLRGEHETRPPAVRADVTPHAPYATVVGTYNSPDGRERDRSIRDAYFKIIENAETSIYIEDQYLVNLEVASRLNAKIKQPQFKFLTFVTQHASETTDLLIPARKRQEFLDVVYGAESAAVRAKVAVGVLDKTLAKQYDFHPGMHAKTLIADDSIAMIGSPNVSQRSFTCDSETAVVLIDDGPSKTGFAQTFRQETWKEFVRTSPPFPALYKDPSTLPLSIRGTARAHTVTEYKGGDVDDLDVAIKKRLDRYTIRGYRLVPMPVDELFSLIWDHLLETRVVD